MADFSDIVCPFAAGVRVTVRAKPGTAKARDVRVVDIGNDKRAIEISVAAEAKEGKANKALIARMAEEWNLPRKSITLKVGDTGRVKVFEIAGDAAQIVSDILARLA